MRLRRRREPDPFAHDSDWHGELDDVRQALDVRRTRRLCAPRHASGTERVELLKPCTRSTEAAATHQPPTDRQADRGHEGGPTP